MPVWAQSIWSSAHLVSLGACSRACAKCPMCWGWGSQMVPWGWQSHPPLVEAASEHCWGAQELLL